MREGDEIITSDNRILKIKKYFRSKSYKLPRLIRAHQYGKNIPMIDTYISDYHAFRVNNKWRIPKKIKLPKKKFSDKIVYYHLQLDNYQTDHLVVNGIEMESWDGKLPNEH